MSKNIDKVRSKPIIERCPQCGKIVKHHLNFKEFKAESKGDFNIAYLSCGYYKIENQNVETKLKENVDKMSTSLIQFRCKHCGKLWTSNSHFINDIGCLYFEDKCRLHDYGEAFKYFQTAANQGNAAAMYNLGVCYKNGFGCTQNKELAIKYFKESAEMDFKYAKKILKEMN